MGTCTHHLASCLQMAQTNFSHWRHFSSNNISSSQIRKSLSAASKLLLVLASVHSRLDYCNSVLHSLPWSRLQLLQSVLNSAARLTRGLGRFDHIIPVLIDLHWLPYPQRISYKICLLMFKCLKGLTPAYLSDLCVGTAAVMGRSGLRSAALR